MIQGLFSKQICCAIKVQKSTIRIRMLPKVQWKKVQYDRGWNFLFIMFGVYFLLLINSAR